MKKGCTGTQQTFLLSGLKEENKLLECVLVGNLEVREVTGVKLDITYQTFHEMRDTILDRRCRGRHTSETVKYSDDENHQCYNKLVTDLHCNRTYR